MATPKAREAGRATSMADKPPQKSLTRAERTSAIGDIMRPPGRVRQDLFELPHHLEPHSTRAGADQTDGPRRSARHVDEPALVIREEVVDAHGDAFPG
jgi:hypothetical protein